MLHRFLLFLLISLPIQIRAQNSSLTKPVVVVNAGPQGADELGAGIITGELNGRLYVVTAHHVVKNFQDQVRVQLNSYPEKVSARIDLSEPELDLAILSIQIPDGYTTPTSFGLASQLPEVTDEVVVIGHPNGALWDINRVVRIKATQISGDYHSALLTLYENGLDNGNSGGVVLNQDNQLIAMIQKVSGSQVTCLRASLIERVLSENGFPDNLMTGFPDLTHSSYTDRYAGDMVWVEGGSFMMGSTVGNDDQKPVRQVTLEGFWIGKYEVTNELFCTFLNEKGNQSEGGTMWLGIESSSCDITRSDNNFVPKSGKNSHPVCEVSWFGAKAYVAWMSTKTGHSYHLPTEAQWEYAARGGQNSRSTTYAGSTSVDEVSWYFSNSNSTPHPVGQKAANELGLYDMSGNVWEWCNDWYDANYYSSLPSSNPSGPASGTYRVIRGGSWSYGPRYLCVAARSVDFPVNGYLSVGFRPSRMP